MVRYAMEHIYCNLNSEKKPSNSLWLPYTNDFMLVMIIIKLNASTESKEKRRKRKAMYCIEAYILSLLCSNNLKSHKNLQVNENSSL